MEGGNPRDGLAQNAGAADGQAMQVVSNEPGAKGKAVLETQGCRACHQVGNAVLAPSLEGIYGTKQPLTGGSSVSVDDNYIRESILNPTAKVVAGFNPVMPPYMGLIKEEEIQQVIQYIKSTSSKTGSK
jgi:cytochrome c oxidase subunit 2